MFYHSHPNIYQLIKALHKVLTGRYTKINCTAVKNLKQAKRTVEKEDIISKKMLQYSNDKISRLSFIQAVPKQCLPQKL
jgi:hypothetical protein